MEVSGLYIHSLLTIQCFCIQIYSVCVCGGSTEKLRLTENGISKMKSYNVRIKASRKADSAFSKKLKICSNMILMTKNVTKEIHQELGST